MTTSKSENDTSNTIASGNDELRHDKQSSDIRDHKGDADGDGTTADPGPDTIAAGNKELREEESSGNRADDDEPVDEPLADKSDVTAPMHNADDPVNNARKVPGVDPDRIEAMRDESQQEIDLTEGRLRDVNLTQGRSVIDAEFDDRGPATHTHPVTEQ